jgi:hypothetical protein
MPPRQGHARWGGPVSTGKPVGNRKVIHATCLVHGGCIGFTNLVVTKRDGTLVLDPHATGQCLLTLDKDAARELYETLGQWFG